MQNHSHRGFPESENDDPFEKKDASPSLSPAGLYGPVLPSPAPQDLPEDRDIIDRVGDEISSWFGDELANMRLEDDALNDAGGPEAVADEDLRLAVRDALMSAADFNGSGIDATVSNGEVTLNGAVLTTPEVYLAADCARRVAGVRQVHNALLVRQVPGAAGTI
jgi:BON domain